MTIHIAIFKWKEGAKKSEVNKIVNDLRGLESQLGGEIKIYCGENFSKQAKGFTHAVVVIAKNKKGLDAYRNHPIHKAIATRVEVIEEDGIGMDFES